MRKLVVFAALVAALVTALTVLPAASAQNNARQVGLVNLSVGNVDILNNVNLAVAANVAATICGVNVPVAVLAQQLLVDGSETVCETVAGPVVVEQAQGGGGPGQGGGGNNARQAGLVNVALGDVAILNNVNLAVAANVAATVCGVNVPVALLAQQVFLDGSETVCETTAGPLTVEQAQGGGGGNARPNGEARGGGNNARQAGLVNIALGNLAILNDVNAAVAANVAATVCGVNVPVAVLARQIIADGSRTVCETDAGDLVVRQAL